MKIYLDKEDINPGLELLLCIVTCGIYEIYWFYKLAKMISEAQEKVGLKSEDDSILYIVLLLFTSGLGFLICPAIAQSKLNEVWQK